MEPLFRNLVIGLVPQMRQIPPSPFDRETLQRAFVDVNRVKPFSQFVFLPGDSGAQMLNSQEDRLVLTPQLVQYFATVDSTVGRTREVALEVLKTVADRLKLDLFVQIGVDVTGHAPAPGDRPDARLFLREQLLKGSTHADELGADFFAAGIKFRRFDDPATPTKDENLSIEPLLLDNSYLWINYSVQRVETVKDLDVVAEWIDDAFNFVSGPTMTILEA
jgi:hypothetical protein